MGLPTLPVTEIVNGEMVVNGLTFQQYRNECIRHCAEMANIPRTKKNKLGMSYDKFRIHPYWNNGSPPGWCAYCFMNSKVYRGMRFHNRQKQSALSIPA